MKVLEFDIWADYAQFRKFYTNMSPLTYQIPPRTVIAGIIGGIIGIDKAENPEKFSPEISYIGIQILQQSRNVKIPVNNLKTSGGMSQFSRFKEHKPTHVEYLKCPKYRIYFSHNDDGIYQKLLSHLKEHKSQYTICLGISNCLANFSYIKEIEYSSVSENKEWHFIKTAIKDNDVIDIDFGSNIQIFRTLLPRAMKNDRETFQYEQYIFESSGKKMKVIPKEYWIAEDGTDKICWL